MDDFVRNKLTEWDLSEWIEKFQDEGIDTESLYCLGHEEIAALIPKVGPRAKFKKKLKLLKGEQNTTNAETVDSPAQVHPSTSASSDQVKRKLDLQGESSNWQSPSRKQRCEPRPGSYSEGIILSEVKNIMRYVQKKLPDQDNKLEQFLKKKINDLEIEKRELVGVFGKTGAGKSSLINAVIGEKNLLPIGRVKACTTVMIKVEANMLHQRYEAEIEFITKEEWKDELWSSLNFLGDNADQEDEQEDEQEGDQEDDEDQDTVDKLLALYGEEWRDKTPENLMENKYFKEIPEFLLSKRKLLTAESAKELSAKLVKYTRSESNDGEGKEVKRWYWPLVKCVTVRVPNNDLLQHVTLVDLPGNGDRNKSRDKMWKGVVGSCSTVWIVTEMKRAAAEREAWDILKSASSLIGNGGECQRIHFICTMSDDIGDTDDRSRDAVRALIFQNNIQAKEEVNKEFRKLKEFKKHFSYESFKVFTVSSKEFLKQKRLTPEETEIPRLQEFLQELNDCHSETLNYVSGAHGILSLIQGARSRAGADRNTDVCRELEEKMVQELEKVRQTMQKTYDTFERCLTEGVEKSKSSWDRLLKSVLYPPRTKGGAFHKILKCVVQNGGTHKPKNRKLINLNMTLTSCLTDSTDEEFKKTFPNEAKCGPFNGIINSFSLETERLMRERPEYKDVELQLIFLKTEEEKMKTKLNKIIREQKKMIYNSLMETIEDNMQECYEKAAEIRGGGSLKNMKRTIENHVQELKDIMFQRAKNVMLEHLEHLMELILDKLENTMQESIELSLNTDGDSIPDVSDELQMVKNYSDELKENSTEEPLDMSADPPVPATHS
ncbi:nuclear GTPase SLIP-GC-like isoform X1 [Epinephelus fuscoguttatus]|uniref:nuclear GTPase SLIP-GC-like isoform X1 n=1 Tax=Epinephelus fuscoguttatus TaxID=293821 RepID=UPI0020D0CE49|nr:nuclear GTPase SLIP-GC-like isoform X1 [Epinephelus fuscoguttatus]XP_049418338.1 nuclear GTPase SLIP-GC-like isoform X1 [Epinephelus fuscoguttatus]XP_049418339.1 nuclear GTPase SLIP-GC-like isoform X1 [Epinephelus fuscoguttatus]